MAYYPVRNNISESVNDGSYCSTVSLEPRTPLAFKPTESLMSYPLPSSNLKNPLISNVYPSPKKAMFSQLWR